MSWHEELSLAGKTHAVAKENVQAGVQVWLILGTKECEQTSEVTVSTTL